MRGSPGASANNSLRIGIIPAHAGLTRSYYYGCNKSGAHRWKATRADCSPGSSPRMRGSRFCNWRHITDTGIIPAHAGLTDRLQGGRRSSWDHPRACGAHLMFDKSREYLTGSSPRMRGSHIFSLLLPHYVGIIPAHAGLTDALAVRLTDDWDHPRACGAHLIRLRSLVR